MGDFVGSICRMIFMSCLSVYVYGLNDVVCVVVGIVAYTVGVFETAARLAYRRVRFLCLFLFKYILCLFMIR